jgi:hypothetical protein
MQLRSEAMACLPAASVGLAEQWAECALTLQSRGHAPASRVMPLISNVSAFRPNMDTGSAYIFGIALAPAWVPPLRWAIFLLRKEKTSSRAFVWWYSVAFIWAAGGVSFQLAIQIPSGIGYALVLLSAWPMMLAGIVSDPFFREEVKDDNEQR